MWGWPGPWYKYEVILGSQNCPWHLEGWEGWGRGAGRRQLRHLRGGSNCHENAGGQWRWEVTADFFPDVLNMDSPREQVQEHQTGNRPGL